MATRVEERGTGGDAVGRGVEDVDDVADTGAGGEAVVARLSAAHDGDPPVRELHGGVVDVRRGEGRAGGPLIGGGVEELGGGEGGTGEVLAPRHEHPTIVEQGRGVPHARAPQAVGGQPHDRGIPSARTAHATTSEGGAAIATGAAGAAARARGPLATRSSGGGGFGAAAAGSKHGEGEAKDADGRLG